MKLPTKNQWRQLFKVLDKALGTEEPQAIGENVTQQQEGAPQEPKEAQDSRSRILRSPLHLLVQAKTAPASSCLRLFPAHQPGMALKVVRSQARVRGHAQ